MQPATTTPRQRPPPAGERAPRDAPQARWQVRLLGAVEASDGVNAITRFPSRAVAALLARLALAPDRAHGREELVELLWPGVALAVGRNRLRQVLSTLKSLLEAPGVPGTAVLQADRLSVRVVPGGLACDALRFELLARGGWPQAARGLYRGEFMPGHFDGWIHDERQRLAALLEALGPPTPDALGESPASAPAAVSAGIGLAPPTLPLPSYLTRLFGVDMAVARVRSLVRVQRLVTLLGPGGSGKTRLAVEVVQAFREGLTWLAEAAAPAFARTAFVSLAACEQAPQVAAAMARALQLPAGTGDDTARLVAALAGQPVLLVLDNFEQLVGVAEGELSTLLSALPQLHVLVTSRRALGLDGEVLVGAEPLDLPPLGADLAGAAASAAVALFVDRARNARADFHLGPRNHAAVVALVRALHGMPLAIELAAARVRSFSPAEMAGLLASDSGGHLALLARAGPRAGHDARHASMAEVIAWSWRLLDTAAQRRLAALSCFVGDAGIGALASVLGEPLARAAAHFDDLAGHSLLQVVPADVGAAGEPGHARFGLVEPVREFVRAQWPAADLAELQLAVRRWLLDWALALAPTVTPTLVAPELRSVHAFLAAADQAPATALRLALALRGFWDTDGLPAALQSALERALALQAPHAPGLASEAHELLAYLRFEAGFKAQALAHADAALAAAGNDASRRARALVRRAWVDIASDRSALEPGAHTGALQAGLDEALQLAQRCGDREAQARALHQMAVLASHAGADWAGAEALLAQSQALWLALGNRQKAFARLRNRAQCWARLGRVAEARACFELCERTAHEEGDAVGRIDSLLSLSSLLTAVRQWAAALDIDRRCIALCWQGWHRHGLGYALWNPPLALARLRRPEPAMQLMGFAATFWASSFGPLGRDDHRTVRRVRTFVRAQLGAARAQALWDEGAAMDLPQAVALALQA